MKLSPKTAIISRNKLIDYILNPDHYEGGSKARFLKEIGYDQSNWQLLAKDLREQHLLFKAIPGKSSPYGEKFEITGELVGPTGIKRRIRSIWIIRKGENFARFITLIPEKKYEV